MENQIQLYHDLTAFWLDKDWKTPREKVLEKEIIELRQRLSSLEGRINNALLVVRTLLGYNNLMFFCPHCAEQSCVEYDKERRNFFCWCCNAEIF